MLILIIAGANSLLRQQVASVDDGDSAVGLTGAQMVENFRYWWVFPDFGQQKRQQKRESLVVVMGSEIECVLIWLKFTVGVGVIKPGISFVWCYKEDQIVLLTAV